MMKAPSMFFLSLILLFSVSAETVDFSEVDGIIDEYNSGSIDIAQFIVLVNSHLKSEYGRFGEGFTGFTESDRKSMLGDAREDSKLVKHAKDFDLLFEFHKTMDGEYAIMFGLAPGQKAMDRAVSDAEREYADKSIAEEQRKIDTSQELKELKELERQKEQTMRILDDKEDDGIRAELQGQARDIEEEIAEIRRRLDEKQDVLDGKVQIDFSDFDIESVICEARYNEYMRMRGLFEGAMPGFPKWYFGELKKGVEEYFTVSSGHEYLMHQIHETNSAIAELEPCAENKKKAGKIEVDHDTGKEMLKVWEKDGETYYQFYFMPSKEMMKGIIETKVTDPTAKTSRGNGDARERMEKIKKLADKYGGSFDAVVKILDSDGKSILHKQVTINPDVIISSKTVSENPVDVDVSLEIDYDKMYEYMEYISKDVEGSKAKNADWSKNAGGSDTGHFFGIISKGFGMWISGVKVRPMTEVPKLLFNLKLVTEALSD